MLSFGKDETALMEEDNPFRGLEKPMCSSGCDKSTGSASRILRWDLEVSRNDAVVFQINTIMHHYYWISMNIC